MKNTYVMSFCLFSALQMKLELNTWLGLGLKGLKCGKEDENIHLCCCVIIFNAAIRFDDAGSSSSVAVKLQL